MKKRRPNPVLHCLAAIALALWLFPEARVVSAQTKVSIVANLILSSNLLPLWIAHEQGLFARQGIDAQVLFVEPPWA